MGQSLGTSDGRDCRQYVYNLYIVSGAVYYTVAFSYSIPITNKDNEYHWLITAERYYLMSNNMRKR